MPVRLARLGVEPAGGVAQDHVHAVPHAPLDRLEADAGRVGAVLAAHHERGPVSRVYAWVREPGTIATGDVAEIVP